MDKHKSTRSYTLDEIGLVTGKLLQEATRHDSGKPQLHHIHPIFWKDYLRAHDLPLLIFRMSEAMDGFFYYHVPFAHNFLNEFTPPELHKMTQVLKFGSQKYDSLNYAKGMAYSRVLNSFRRHILALVNGEKEDYESHLPTEGHVYCNFMFLYLYSKTGTGTDDRPDLRPPVEKVKNE